VGLVGDIAMVTGAGRGIGKVIASRLLEHGANVVLFELDPETADKAYMDLSEVSAKKILLAIGSVTSARDLQAAFDRAELELHGTVQMLVNNAGVAALSLVTETAEADWDHVVNVNLKGTFLASREFARRVVRSATVGAVVNVTSTTAASATEGLGAYCAAKAGVAQFTKVCAAEWGRHGIRVNAIAPGSVRTQLTDETGVLSGDMEKELVARTPLGRLGEPHDIANVTSFLLSDDAYWITGATVAVDGGQHIRGLPSYWHLLNP
jgi:NAD(P)-dependent dehydrogenase (short-subunit alcohol dehydrogenase family)